MILSNEHYSIKAKKILTEHSAKSRLLEMEARGLASGQSLWTKESKAEGDKKRCSKDFHL